jgi:hypothetical protein
MEDFKLAPHKRRLFENFHSDPTLREGIERWSEGADKEPQ